MKNRIEQMLPAQIEDLKALVRIPSVSRGDPAEPHDHAAGNAHGDRAEHDADHAPGGLLHVEQLRQIQIPEQRELRGKQHRHQKRIDRKADMQKLERKDQQGRICDHDEDPVRDRAAGRVRDQHRNARHAAGDDARRRVQKRDRQRLDRDHQRHQDDRLGFAQNAPRARRLVRL